MYWNSGSTYDAKVRMTSKFTSGEVMHADGSVPPGTSRTPQSETRPMAPSLVKMVAMTSPQWAA